MADYLNWAQSQPQPKNLTSVLSAWGPGELSQQFNPGSTYGPSMPAASDPFSMNTLKQGSMYGDFMSGITGKQGGNNPLSGISGWMKDSGILGSTDANGVKTDGWGGLAVGAAGGLMNAYMGMKQYGLSKDIFENNKAQFERNFAAQKGTTNAQLSDRQTRRNYDANLNGVTGTASVADYMAKYGVK